MIDDNHTGIGAQMIATSQPLAVEAGLLQMVNGGNAVDAALAAAIALTVVEPSMNGLGGDVFAIVHQSGQKPKCLNASGRSPLNWSFDYFNKLYDKMPMLGWDSVTVPGGVSGWVELSANYGRLSFNELFKPAIGFAKEGYQLTEKIGQQWVHQSQLYKAQDDMLKTFMTTPLPKPGDLLVMPHHAESLNLIAQSKGKSFYSGSLAEQIIRHAQETGGHFTNRDLSEHKANWCETVDLSFNGYRVHQVPSNTQGVATLIALGMMEHGGYLQYRVGSTESFHYQIECMRHALAVVYQIIADPNVMRVDLKTLLTPSQLKQCAEQIRGQAGKGLSLLPSNHDTVYVTAADADGLSVSLIQSNYMGFGSGIVVPDTGIALHNRGSGFVINQDHPNCVDGGKRPFHTLMPGFVTQDNVMVMSLGCMGGDMQAQGQLQLLINTLLGKLSPQDAIDKPRWKLDAQGHCLVESNFPKEVVRGLRQKGHVVKVMDSNDKAAWLSDVFGGAQMIVASDGGYIGGSDPRKDGKVGLIV